MARPRGGPKADETRERIIAAAVSVFAERGLSGATLTQIAANAGMRAPSLLYHFDSKDTLFNEVIRQTYHALSHRVLEALPKSGTGEEIMGALLQVLQGFSDENRDLFRVVNAELLSSQQNGGAAISDTLLPLLERIEMTLRQSSSELIHPDAPIRQVLLYILSAHTVRSNLGELAEDLWGPDDRELEIGMLLASSALNWQPPKGQ